MTANPRGRMASAHQIGTPYASMFPASFSWRTNRRLAINRIAVATAPLKNWAAVFAPDFRNAVTVDSDRSRPSRAAMAPPIMQTNSVRWD
jgi:hypothetical protein